MQIYHDPEDKFVSTKSFVHKWSSGDISYCIPMEWFCFYFQNWNTKEVKLCMQEEPCDYISINGFEYFGFRTEEDFFMWNLKLL